MQPEHPEPTAPHFFPLASFPEGMVWLCAALHERPDGAGEVLAGHGHGPVLADEELALEVPGRVGSARLGLEELPRRPGAGPVHRTLGQDVPSRLRREVRFGGELGDVGVRGKLLPSELVARKGKDDKRLAKLRREGRERLVLPAGCASS